MMDDFKRYIGKNTGGDDCDLLISQYRPIGLLLPLQDGDDCDLLISQYRPTTTLTGRRSRRKMQSFSHYCRSLGRDLNPGYQTDVLNSKRSQFVIKISNVMCDMLRAFCVEALGHVKNNIILLNHVIK